MADWKGARLYALPVAVPKAADTPIPDAFLDLPLPSRDGLGVTLLHLGRIKTGVGPNLALGPALQVGQTVTLTIDDPQPGAPLQCCWLVQLPLRQPLSPGNWQLHPPKALAIQPLRVILPVALPRRKPPRIPYFLKNIFEFSVDLTRVRSSWG